MHKSRTLRETRRDELFRTREIAIAYRVMGRQSFITLGAACKFAGFFRYWLLGYSLTPGNGYLCYKNAFPFRCMLGSAKQAQTGERRVRLKFTANGDI